MTKEEHIAYWLQQADYDWESVTVLFNQKRYIHALFFAHLTLEKLCKARWVKDNEQNIPPKTHNLLYLLSQTQIRTTED